MGENLIPPVKELRRIAFWRDRVVAGAMAYRYWEGLSAKFREKGSGSQHALKLPIMLIVTGCPESAHLRTR
jgi:hypothetical protein